MKYTKEILIEAAKKAKCVADVCRIIGTSHEGSMNTHIRKQLKKHGIDTSHFLGKAAHSGQFHTGRSKKLTATQLLVSNKERREKGFRLRRALLEIGRKYECVLCPNKGLWNNKKLMLEVDHIDKNCFNCSAENLRFLCPNCHSQETYMNFGVIV